MTLPGADNIPINFDTNECDPGNIIFLTKTTAYPV